MPLAVNEEVSDSVPEGESLPLSLAELVSDADCVCVSDGDTVTVAEAVADGEMLAVALTDPGHRR